MSLCSGAQNDVLDERICPIPSFFFLFKCLVTHFTQNLGLETQRSGCLPWCRVSGLILPNGLIGICEWKEREITLLESDSWKGFTGDTVEQMPFCLGTGNKPVELKSFLLSGYQQRKQVLGIQFPSFFLYGKKEAVRLHGSFLLWRPRPCWVSPTCHLSVSISSITFSLSCVSTQVCTYTSTLLCTF